MNILFPDNSFYVFAPDNLYKLEKRKNRIIAFLKKGLVGWIVIKEIKIQEHLDFDEYFEKYQKEFSDMAIHSYTSTL